MPMERVETLRARHADLDSQIAEEVHRPHPDDIRITELKREKLKLKDEITRLTVN